MSTIRDLAEWNTNKLHERPCQKGGAAKHILDADCRYEDGAFALFSLPRKLPRLFSIRFTAPADFTPGDIFTLKGRELTVKTLTMEAPKGKLFAAGAVVQCAIDMEQNMAFFVESGEVQAVGLQYPDYSAGRFLWKTDAAGMAAGYVPTALSVNTIANGAGYTITEPGYVRLTYYYKFSADEKWFDAGIRINGKLFYAREYYMPSSYGNQSIGSSGLFPVKPGDIVQATLNTGIATTVTPGSENYGLEFFPLAFAV